MVSDLWQAWLYQPSGSCQDSTVSQPHGGANKSAVNAKTAAPDHSGATVKPLQMCNFTGILPTSAQIGIRLAHALAYVAYTVKYRLHLRLVRTGLSFTRSLYHCISALQLEISTEPFAQNCKRRFPYDRYYIELLWLLLNAKLSFATWFRLHQPRTVCSGTPQLSAIFLIVLAIRPFITPAICQYLV